MICMNLRDLRYLVALADEGTSAALRLVAT